MASSSPGRGQSPRPSGQHLCPGIRDLSREERLFLRVQFEILDWTKAQPGEDPNKLQKRRAKVKGLIQKATQAFRMKMAVLTNLRNRRDRASSIKRAKFREAIEALKTQCSELWDLLWGLCERGLEEKAFLLEIRHDMRRTSKDRRQAARRRPQQASQSQVVEVVEPVPRENGITEEAGVATVSTQVEDAAPVIPCNAVEGPREHAESQPVRGAGERAGSGRLPSEAQGRQVGEAQGSGGRHLKPAVVLTELPKGTKTLAGQRGKMDEAVGKSGVEHMEAVEVSPVNPVSNPELTAAAVRAMGEGQASPGDSSNRMVQSGKIDVSADTVMPGMEVIGAGRVLVAEDGGLKMADPGEMPSTIEGGVAQAPQGLEGVASPYEAVEMVGGAPGS